MNIKDINELKTLLENNFNVTIEEDSLKYCYVGDDKYWILPILESSPELDKLHNFCVF